MGYNELEEGSKLDLDFSKLSKIAAKCKDVIPVAVQDIDSNEVILLSYINELALKESVKTKIATFWSTSRNELWIKGKTSGNYYEVKEIFVNCEQNSLLFKVKSKVSGICHTNNRTGQARNCFYRKLNLNNMELENIDP
jgi:phosphoribosyl-AMP cyclohydrolase